MTALDQAFRAAGAAAWGGVAYDRLTPEMTREDQEKVRAQCPQPRTVLVAAFPYYAGDRPGNLSLYARGEDYHRALARRLNTVCDFLSRQYPMESFLPAADNSPLPEREAARLAGLGKVGRHGLLILPPYGSFLFLGTILTGAALALPEREAAPACEDCGDFTYLNPGSVSIPKENSPHSYMIYEDGVFSWKNLETGETYRTFSIS